LRRDWVSRSSTRSWPGILQAPESYSSRSCHGWRSPPCCCFLRSGREAVSHFNSAICCAPKPLITGSPRACRLEHQRQRLLSRCARHDLAGRREPPATQSLCSARCARGKIRRALVTFVISTLICECRSLRAHVRLARVRFVRIAFTSHAVDCRMIGQERSQCDHARDSRYVIYRA